MTTLHRDALTGEWVSLNGDRQSRPVTDFETTCPFCPGPSSEVGELPFDVAVFENKFPAFRHPGNAEVVVYSPRHYDDLAYLPPARARLIWKVWADRVHDLEEEPGTRAVFIFENRGQKVGATIGHPHGQIYAYPYIPPRLQTELRYFAHTCPLCRDVPDTLVLSRGRYWRLEVPWALRMPYQVHLVPERHVGSLGELGEDEQREGARMMQQLLRAYDRFFGMRTALVMALYQTSAARAPYHLRWDFMPIDRGGGKIKYLAGSELAMGAFVVDMVPEQVRERLKPALDWEEQEEEKLGE